MHNEHGAKQIYKAINTARYPLLISHENPDGDTLGASLALSYHLNNGGRSYEHFCIDKPAYYFSFLPQIEKINSNQSKVNLKNHDLVITIDCGSIKRTGLGDNLEKMKNDLSIINIDHHQSNDLFGHYNLVNPTASSTSEIMYKFFEINSIKIDKYIATALLTGILSDTMNFTNAATTKDSLKIASTLLECGARTSQILNNLMQNRNLFTLKFWGKILSQTQIQPEYNFAYTAIDYDDFISAKIEREDIDGLANFLSTLQDVNFILVLSEEEDAAIKGSLRTTKDNIDVSKIAKIFGGGGHKKAAGFRVEKNVIIGTLDWKKFIITAIINELNKI
ncbi:DHH family phosphoesterase [Candidatus Falkowbacteria bacterium]|nr:DHH family phosphoesterase [Candidatus Falkowbacteria bacterium]